MVALMMAEANEARANMQALIADMQSVLNKKKSLRDSVEKAKEAQRSVDAALRAEYDALTASGVREGVTFDDYTVAEASIAFRTTNRSLCASESGPCALPLPESSIAPFRS